MVERLFLAVPRGCLWFVIVVFPDHTYLLFLVYQNSSENFDKRKARDFNATSLSTYNISTLYTTLPHNLIQD